MTEIIDENNETDEQDIDIWNNENKNYQKDAELT